MQKDIMYKLKQLGYMLTMILLNLVYSLINIFFWVVLAIGSIFWDVETFDKMISHLHSKIPEIPDLYEDEEDYSL